MGKCVPSTPKAQNYHTKVGPATVSEDGPALFGLEQGKQHEEELRALEELLAEEESLFESSLAGLLGVQEEAKAAATIDSVADFFCTLEKNTQPTKRHASPESTQRPARHSIYRGVSKTSGGKWGAKFRGKRIDGASACTTEEDAARAYDAYLKDHVPDKYLKFRNFCGECGQFCNGLNLANYSSLCTCHKPPHHDQNQGTKRKANALTKHLLEPVVVKKKNAPFLLPSYNMFTPCSHNLSLCQLQKLLHQTAAVASL